MGHSSVTKKGPGLAKLQKLVHQLKVSPEVHVGIFEGSGRSGGSLTNVEIGIVHEFGAPAAGIPERSFLRHTADRLRAQWMNLMTKALGKAADGKISVHEALELVGLKVVADVKAGITSGSGIDPPLKPRTIARKGSSRPLVDSSQLVNSITHKVKA